MPYSHTLHPRTQQRVQDNFDPLERRFPKKKKRGPKRSALDKFNDTLALWITKSVGSMWCAYLFTGLALVSAGQAVAAFLAGNLLASVAWLSQTFFQLVLLPIIIVGQNLQSKDSEKRAEQMYEDTKAILHEVIEVQQHLFSIDEKLDTKKRSLSVIKKKGD